MSWDLYPRIYTDEFYLALGQFVSEFSEIEQAMQVAYATYYNKIRTHRSLDKDAPIWRPVQRTGVITSNPILGGLHHHYIRI
jgi:hypothetical protein